MRFIITIIFNYALQPLRLIVRSRLDVPNFATRRLHTCHHARAPSGGRWNCGARNGRYFCLNAHLHVAFRDLFTCRKATTWDRRLYFPSEGRRAEDFVRPKNPTASAGCEPANLGTKGQHATSRLPKPLIQRDTSSQHTDRTLSYMARRAEDPSTARRVLCGHVRGNRLRTAGYR
jgi:hypothetical protein